MRFCTITLGCKVNQYETQAMAGLLVSRGHERAETAEGCDVCVVNTCAVTAESARKSRQAVRRIKKAAPGALIAVCGCLSQLQPVAAAGLGADLVGGSGGRYSFAMEIEKAAIERLNGEKPSGEKPSGGIPLGEKHTEERTSAEARTTVLVDDPSQRDVFEELPPDVYTAAAGRTRALLKIQDGCDNYCAYCVIPYARGRARSLPPGRAAGYARELDRRGFREIVITGIEISAYGSDLGVSGFVGGDPVVSGPGVSSSGGSPALIDAVRAISAAAPGARLRLGSLDPGIVTEEFCRELSGIGRVCDHFHLSLQSGCDETLRRMGRKYTAGAVRDAVTALRRRFPGCGVTADLIVGFPGETEEEFDRTIEFIRSVSFSDMHVFPFSARPGTRAAEMPGQPDKATISGRARIAVAAASEMAEEFRSGLVGKTLEVLFERERGGFWVGHSGNYAEVAVESGGARNELRRVLITGVADGRVFGKIVCLQETTVI